MVGLDFQGEVSSKWKKNKKCRQIEITDNLDQY